jgi:hypothetical protein
MMTKRPALTFVGLPHKTSPPAVYPLPHRRAPPLADGRHGRQRRYPSDSGPFAKPMNEILKVVFSQSLESADWDETTIAAGDLSDAITRLRRERSEGYLLAHGGRDRLDR